MAIKLSEVRLRTPALNPCTGHLEASFSEKASPGVQMALEGDRIALSGVFVADSKERVVLVPFSAALCVVPVPAQPKAK